MNLAADPDLRFFDAPSHVLVTGGTGFIGCELVALLLNLGHRVSVLTRDPARATRLLGSAVRPVRSLDEIGSDVVVDAVVNLAGARILGQRWTAARKAALLHSRVGTTQALAAWMAGRKTAPPLLLSASAIGYYGTQAPGDDRPLDEGAPPQPVFMSQLCQQWEQAAAACAAFGVRVACLRFGLVLGSGGGGLPVMLLPVRLGAGGRMGRGSQWYSWIHLRDLLAGMAHAARHAPAGVTAYNFTAPDAVSQLEFTRVAAAQLHRPSVLPTPAWPVRLALGEQSDLLLEGQRVVPARLLAEGFGFRYPTLQAALADLCA